MKELTREDVKRISTECMDAVRKVLEANGLALEPRHRTTFDAKSFSTKFEASVLNDDGTSSWSVPSVQAVRPRGAKR